MDPREPDENAPAEPEDSGQQRRTRSMTRQRAEPSRSASSASSASGVTAASSTPFTSAASSDADGEDEADHPLRELVLPFGAAAQVSLSSKTPNKRVRRKIKKAARDATKSANLERIVQETAKQLSLYTDKYDAATDKEPIDKKLRKAERLAI